MYEKYLHDLILVLNDLSPPWMSEALTDYIIIYALKKKKYLELLIISCRHIIQLKVFYEFLDDKNCVCDIFLKGSVFLNI